MDPLEETIAYYDANAEFYARRWLGARVMLEDLELFVQNLPGSWVLDAGCGPGRDVRYFVEQGLDADGIDLSERLLEIARREVPGASLMYMDMRQLHFPNGFYDGVWSCASLLHLDRGDVPKALREFWRVLVPGGILYASVKEGAGEAWVESDEKGRVHYTYFTKEEFRGLIELCGFEIFHLYEKSAGKHANFLGVFARKVEI